MKQPLRLHNICALAALRTIALLRDTHYITGTESRCALNKSHTIVKATFRSPHQTAREIAVSRPASASTPPAVTLEIAEQALQLLPLFSDHPLLHHHTHNSTIAPCYCPGRQPHYGRPRQVYQAA
jgi:hypothetical protein